MGKQKLSIVISSTYAESGKYMPLIKKLEREICCCYGIGFPRNWNIQMNH